MHGPGDHVPAGEGVGGEDVGGADAESGVKALIRTGDGSGFAKRTWAGSRL